MAGQVVQITINVTDGNASEAVQQVVASLNALGPAGQAAGAAAGAGLDEVSEHAVSAREQIRLLNEETGLRVPRAMQSVIASSQAMSAAIGAIGPALIGIGAADILIHMGEAAYGAYQKYIELKGVIDDSNAVIKSFGDSAEAAMNRASDATERYIRLTQGAAAADTYKLNRMQSTPIGIPQYQSDQFKNLPDAVKGDFEKITGESIMPKDIDAAIAKLKTYETSAQNTLNFMQQLHDHPLAPDPYSNDPTNFSSQSVMQQQKRVEIGAQVIADLEAQQNAYADNVKENQAQIDADNKEKAEAAIAKAKEKNEAILALETSARNATLSGDALLEAQREEAIDSFVRRYGQSQAAINAIDDDYLAKVSALYKQEDDKANEKNTKVLAAQEQFIKEMDQVGTTSTDQQVYGYAHIADEAEKSAKRIQDAFSKFAGSGASPTAVMDAQMLATDQTLEVEANADRERQQLHAKTMEEIVKEEQQAARMGLAPWQQQEMAIVDEYDDRVRKIQEDVRVHVMTEQEGAQAVAAAWQTANAQMQRDEEETRDKIASGLQSMFQHPEQFFEKRAMDTAFQLMANEMLSVFKSSSPAGGMLQYIFGMGPQMNTSTNPLTAMESAMGMGGHGHAGLSSSTASNPSMAQFQQGSTTLVTAGQQLMSAASALQSVASTMSTGGGLGVGSRMTGGGLSVPGFAGTGVSTATGAGEDTGDIATSSSSNPMMLPGVGAGVGALGSLSTFGNGLAIPSMSGGAAAGGGAMTGDAGVQDAAENAGSGASAFGAASGIAGGGLMAATSIFSAYQNSNPIAGAMGGAMGGMEMGAALGSVIPGLGTVVGGAIGAIAGGIGGLLAGIFGDQGRSQAESLDVNQIQPALAKDLQDFEAGRSGYETVAPELNAMLVSAQNSTNSMGSGARSYFSSNIQPEIQKVLSSLQQQEIGGRSQITLSAAQYHSGGWIGDFGEMATSDTEGFIHAAQNEFVVNPMAAAAHAPILSAMNSGTNFAYSNNVQPRMPASAGGGNGTQITIQALDSKSVAQWAKAGGGLALMAALNQANRQYSGKGRG